MASEKKSTGPVTIVQLKKYAEDLAELYKSEKGKTKALQAAHEQLVRYAEDLATTISESRSLRRDLDDARGQLRRSERLRLVGEIAGQVAHEIKNPLGPIKGYARLLLENIEQDGVLDLENTKRGLHIIIEEAERIDQRIARLLGVARKAHSSRQTLDPNTAVRRAVMLLEASNELKPGSSVETALCNEQKELPLDPFAVEEAVYNVLINAAQAINERGRIWVQSYWEQAGEKQWFVIQIEDDGPGLFTENIDDLFKPFYTTKPNGAGLGLSIVRTIVKDHGGTVFAARRHGGGAMFTIKVPYEKLSN